MHEERDERGELSCRLCGIDLGEPAEQCDPRGEQLPAPDDPGDRAFDPGARAYATVKFLF